MQSNVFCFKYALVFPENLYPNIEQIARQENGLSGNNIVIYGNDTEGVSGLCVQNSVCDHLCLAGIATAVLFGGYALVTLEVAADAFNAGTGDFLVYGMPQYLAELLIETAARDCHGGYDIVDC